MLYCNMYKEITIMEILFVTPTDNLKLNCVSNGTMLLGTKLLDAGFTVDIVRFGQFSSYNQDYELFISEITSHILKINPKCVSFYTLWTCYHISLRIANEIKRQNKEIIVVFGGPQSSATAEETLKSFPAVDFVCTGEGENTVVPFFSEILHNNSLGLSSIPGLCFRCDGEIFRNTQDNPLCNPNELPNWDERLIITWDPLKEDDIHTPTYYMPIDAGRGCPFSCTFCSTSNFWRRTYRLKSADKIIDDILFFHNKYGINSFSFSHDAFTTKQELVSAVCDKIINENLNITWSCTTRIDCLSEELVHKMIRAGLKTITVGIETGSPRMQKLINKRLNLDYAKKMIAFLKQNKLNVRIFFMYGFPEETNDDLNQTLEMLFDFLDQGINKTYLTFCHFSPATQMTEENFNNLIFDADYKIVSRGIFGYSEEIEMFKSNKSIFSVFYNLHTDIRDKYQYLYYFVYIYDKYRSSMPFLRKHFHGDNLALYTAFHNHIMTFLGQNDFTSDALKKGVFRIIQNTIDEMDEPFKKQLKSIFSFEYDITEIKNSAEDCSIKKTYDFSYLDYSRKIPIENFSEYKTELLIQKKGQKISIQILSITPFCES